MNNIKLILVSESGYNEQHDRFLQSILDEGYELFCAVGKDCELWEEIMDEIAVGNCTDACYITTTSHPNESVDEVIQFAKHCSTSRDSEIDFVHI